MLKQDIIAIGGSVGAVEGLLKLVNLLPKSLDAAVFVVVHTSPNFPSTLPQLLTSGGPIPARHPVNGEPIRPGQIYVAPPDHHMLIMDSQIVLSRGPKENFCRPAIDPLFRSVADVYGPRAAGVVLSGSAFDGTAGLIAIKSKGGVSLVQDPKEAAASSMPRSAVSKDTPDYVAPLRDLVPILVGLTKGERKREKMEGIMPEKSPIQEAVEAAEKNRGGQIRGERVGDLSVYTCPDCGGSLWQLGPKKSVQFRCHVGHVVAGEALLEGQSNQAESAIWAAIRSLIDQSILARQLAESARARGEPERASAFEESGKKAAKLAESLRKAAEFG